jgi:hypothetical protein
MKSNLTSNAPWLEKNALDVERIDASAISKDVTSEVCEKEHAPSMLFKPHTNNNRIYSNSWVHSNNKFKI